MKKIFFLFQKIDLEEILLLAFLLLLPFHLVLKKLLPHPVGTYWKEGVLALLLLAWLWRSLRRRKLLLPRSTLDLPVFLYLGLLILRFATDGDLRVRAWGFYITAMYLPLYWVAAYLIQRRQHLVRYIWLVLLTGVIVSVGGILEYVLDLTLWPSEEVFSRQGFYEVYIYATSIRRVYLTFDSPTTLANYLALILPLAVILVPAVKGWLARVALTLSSLVILTCLILTFSRGLWVATLAVLVGMGLLTGVTERTLRYLGYTFGAAVLAVALWFGIAALTPSKMVSTYQNVVELTDEAFAAVPIQGDVYDFLKHEPMKGEAEVQHWNINDPMLGKRISYTVLFEHPPQDSQRKIVYQVQVPPEGALRFSLALAPEVWIPSRGDGVTFSIYREPQGQEKEGDFIFVRYLNPKSDITDRKWRNFLVNLASYAGQTIELSFITEPGPHGDNSYDWAGWAHPQLVVVQPGFFDSIRKENAVVTHAGSLIDWGMDETNVDRLRAWQKSFLVLRQFPLWGAGLGRTGVASLRTMPEHGFVTESQWLKMAVETGLAGLLIFAFLWYRIFGAGYIAYLKARYPLYRAIMLGTLASLLVIFLNGLVFQNLEVKQANAYFWFFVAVIAALERYRSAKTRRRGRLKACEPSVSLIVINWNGRRFLRRCLEAIREQTYLNIELLIIDNASSDGSVDLLRQDYPDVRLVENSVNVGFCRAFNQGVRMSRGEYVMPLNPDVFMTPDFVLEMVWVAENEERLGSVTGKLLQSTSTGEQIIDSTGLFLDRRRRTYDRGQGEIDRGQYDHLPYAFGACGAAPLYRRAMLESVAIGREFFDEDFFAYYEDADLAWRAQLSGWRCAYAPGAVAYHVRGSGDTLRKKGHMRKELARQINAIKNRYLMLVKNDSFVHLLLDCPWILINEVPRYIYMALLAPRLLQGVIWWVRLFRSAWEKRQIILKRRVVSNSYIRQWFVDPYKASSGVSTRAEGAAPLL